MYINDYSLKAGGTLTGDVLRRLHASTEANYELLYLNTYELMGGTKLTYCTACKKVIRAEYSYPSCSHPSTSVRNTAASCTVQGVRETVCGSCSKVIKTELTACAAHTPGDALTVSTDCDAGGYMTTRCAVCDALLKETYTPLAGHSFSDPVTVTAPTLHTGGSAVCTCGVCGKTQEISLPAIKLGDMDQNGAVESADARLALRAAVGLESPASDAAVLAGDVDNNGSINAEDARLILRLAVALENAEQLMQQYHP